MSFEEIKAALAGKYAIDREIGQGGMAFVYLAFDLRHERHVAIKVLRPHVAAGLGADRFLREIKIAASLSHPNIVPLHDSGEANGMLYSVMPFVEGESLRQRIDREGLLPLEDALAITAQVGAALAYAHSRGIVHRDIKPDNILLSSGQAVVTDFGVARALEAAGETTGLTGAGIAVGTPAYMSPEQARGMTEVDARADQYSLGCTLFEMLAGEPPFHGRTVQSILVRQMTESAPDLTAMRDTVPPPVAEAVRRSLSKTPADRFATIAQFTDCVRTGTPTPTPVSVVAASPAKPRKGRWIALASAALAAVLLLVLTSVSQPVAFEKRDWVLVTDFQNTTGDTVFDDALDRAFAIGLQQSRYVNVFPRSQIMETLHLMGQDSAPALTRELARDVALRRGVRVIANPSISRIGSIYTLAITFLDPESDEALLSRSEDAESLDDVLPALDRLTRRVRRDLGESLTALWGAGVRLDAATTPSLEALRAWTAGHRQWSEDNLDAAADLYRRAIDLDSNFAMAHNDLAQYYYWARNDRERGDYHFARALEQSERVTYRERLTIEATSAAWQGRREDAIATYRVLLAEYPDNANIWDNLGYQYLMLSRWDGATEAYRRAIGLDSLDDNAMVNLATVYNAQGVFDSAIVWYDRAFELQPAYRINPNLNFEFGDLYMQQGNYARAGEVFSWLLDESRDLRARGHRSLALLEMRRGGYADAIDHLQQAIVLSGTTTSPTTTLRNGTYLAAALLTKGRLDAARRELRDLRQLADTSSIEPLFLAILGRLLARSGLVDEAATVADSIVARSRAGNPGDESALDLVRGEVALARGQFDSARSNLERAAVLNSPARPLDLDGLGLTLTLLGEDAAARDVFERILESRAINRESQEPWVLAHYRLARLYDEVGQRDRAVDLYDAFLELWRDADDDLEVLQDARRRLAALTQSDRPRPQ